MGSDTILTMLRCYDNETRAEGIMEKTTVADNPKHRIEAPPIDQSIQPHADDTMDLSERGFQEAAVRFAFEL
jgi:hypothetical protein